MIRLEQATAHIFVSFLEACFWFCFKKIIPCPCLLLNCMYQVQSVVVSLVHFTNFDTLCIEVTFILICDPCN